MRSVIFAVSLLAASVLHASADDHPYMDATGKYAGSYICIPEVTAGARYDAASKAWLPTIFNPGETLIFRLKNLGVREVEHLGENVKAAFYDLTYNVPGQKNPQKCYDLGGDPTGEININSAGTAHCQFWGNYFQLNPETMRFMRTFTYGFVEGEDKEDQTPLVTIGKCSRID